MKIKILLLILQISVLQSVDSQNLQSQAEKAWIELDTMKTRFCKDIEECEQYEKASFLEKRRFEDKVAKNLVRLAEAFLENYPDDPHYYDVLEFFFNYLFEPKFISENISDSVTVVLSKDSGKDRAVFYHQLRVLPIDTPARDRWLKKGKDLATKFLESDASLERKLEIEIALLARDLLEERFLYEYANLQKEPIEAAYWKRFDAQYWESYPLRVQNLLYKYSDLEIVASYVQPFISMITSKHISPSLTEPYWRYFLKATDSTSPLANRVSIKAVHTMAKENLASLEALKSFDDTKPLEMVFTAMDGTKIDLASMRGKVVLIDFWSIWCAPCIKEMPHVQAMYDKYRNQGFEVIGLAANGDASKEQVLKILKKTGATWRQRLDKGKDVTVSYHALYKIASLPTVWLLDKEGNIIDKHARGVRLEPLIRKYLELDK